MKAAYFGTFEPFQNYHLDILKKASEIFESVDIAITINSQTRKYYNFIDCKRIIQDIILNEGIKNCNIEYNYGLNIKYCEERNIDYIIRGFKEKMNIQTEFELLAINKAIYDKTKTLYLVSDIPYISSGTLIELVRNGIDATTYIPKDFLEYMKMYEASRKS